MIPLILVMQELLVDNWDMKWMEDNVMILKFVVFYIFFLFLPAISYYGSAHYGQSTGPIWLNRLYCTGSENNLLDCNRAVDIGNSVGCSHSEDIGLVCPGIWPYKLLRLTCKINVFL